MKCVGKLYRNHTLLFADKVPVVCVVFDEGLNTLETVRNAVDKRIPTIVVEVFKLCYWI